MDVRLATSKDAEAACKVLRRSITELCWPDHHGDQVAIDLWLSNKTPENVAAWIEAADNIVLVAIDDQDLLGIGAMTCIGRVTLNYVHPDRRFRGVSKALLAHLEREATKLGLRELTLQSTKTAEQFYRAAGFVVRPDPTRPDDCTMIKTLNVSA